MGDHYEIKGGVVYKYIFAGNLRVAQIAGSTVSYFHKDHLGSSTVMTNASGVQIESANYEPYGAMRAHTGTTTSGYKFTDQELDAENGLYNYDARLYDPVLGRFITPDTVVQDWYDPQCLNRYSYVRNNPLIYTDPTGKSFWHCLTEIPGAIIGFIFGGPTPWDAIIYQYTRDHDDLHNFNSDAMARHATSAVEQPRIDAIGSAWTNFTGKVGNFNTVGEADHTFYDIISHFGTPWTEQIANNPLLAAKHLIVNDIILGAITAPVAMAESILSNLCVGIENLLGLNKTTNDYITLDYDYGYDSNVMDYQTSNDLYNTTSAFYYTSDDPNFYIPPNCDLYVDGRPVNGGPP